MVRNSVAFCIYLLIGCLAHPAVSFAVNVCKGTYTGTDKSPYFEYQYDKRTFVVLGWAHPMVRGSQNDYEAYQEIEQLARRADCQNAGIKLTQFIASKSKDKAERDRIAKLLDVYTHRIPFGSIGIEFLQDEVDDALEHVQLFETLTAQVISSCPGLKSLTEDADLRAQSLKLIQALRNVDMHLFSNETMAEARYLGSKLNNGLIPITEMEIKSFSKTIKPKAERQMFETFAGISKSISDLGRQRNLKMVENML